MLRRDPIVAEVREAREAYAKQFSYDLRAICRDLKEQEKVNDRELYRPEAEDCGRPRIEVREMSLEVGSELQFSVSSLRRLGARPGDGRWQSWRAEFLVGPLPLAPIRRKV